MKAVLWADTVQMVIVYAGMLTIFIIGCNVLGGVENAWSIAESRDRIVIFEYVKLFIYYQLFHGNLNNILINE